MMEKIYRFFAGRHGMDHLNRAMLFLGLIFILLGRLLSGTVSYFFWGLGYAAELLMLLRAMSRNQTARMGENSKFLRLWQKIAGSFQLRQKMWRERKQFRYFSCPGCKEKMRVPKGRGNIMIICRCCGKEFQRKS